MTAVPEVVLEGDSAVVVGEEVGGQVGDGLGDAQAELGGGGEGVALDVVDVQGEVVEVVGALDVLVGFVAAAIEAGDGVAKFIGGWHVGDLPGLLVVVLARSRRRS